MSHSQWGFNTNKNLNCIKLTTEGSIIFCTNFFLLFHFRHLSFKGITKKAISSQNMTHITWLESVFSPKKVWIKCEEGAGALSFHNFPYDENLRRALNTTSLKCCLQTTDTINRREKIHACVWGFKDASCERASLKFTRFSQKKVGYFSNRVVSMKMANGMKMCKVNKNTTTLLFSLKRL